MKLSTVTENLEILSPAYVEVDSQGKRTKYALSEFCLDLIETENDEQDTILDKVINKNLFDNNEHEKDLKTNPKWDKIDNLFNFQTDLIRYPDNYLDTYSTLHDVGDHHGNCGEVYLPNVKCTVSYESERGEKMFLKHLDKHKYIKDIKTQSILITYGNNVKRKKKYYPDFIMLTHDNRVIICEVKAITNMSYYKSIEKYSVLREYCMKNGYGYGMVAYARDYYSFEYLRDRNYSKKL